MTSFKAGLYLFSTLIVIYLSFSWYKDWEMQKNYNPPFYDDGVCNVAIVPVGGEIGISNSSLLGDVDRIIGDLDFIKNSPQIQAVVLQVDSFGGSAAASETLYNYLLNYKAKPVVTLFRDAGMSGAYMIALPTERIFSGRMTGVGSIGIISSTLNNYEKNKSDGVEYIQLSTGKFKDGLSPDKKIDGEVLAYEQSEIDKLGKMFVDMIVLHRKIPEQVVNDLADGRAWNGEDAQKLGLVDEIGNIDTVLKYLSNRNAGMLEMVPCGIPKY